MQKKIFLIGMFLCLLVLSGRGVQAQVYDPYFYYNYNPYWSGAQYQAEPQQYDPYYELHAMHYQLYLPQYQPYALCCFQRGIVVPGWHGSVAPPPPIQRKSGPAKVPTK